MNRRDSSCSLSLTQLGLDLVFKSHLMTLIFLHWYFADMWKKIVGAPTMDGLVRKPDLLSFYIASKIPVSESTRQELLEIDGISYRLRREIELLESVNLIRCKICKVIIWSCFKTQGVCVCTNNDAMTLVAHLFVLHFQFSLMQTEISRRSDMLVMSSEGPLGAYVNPHGYVHEIMTLYRANGLALRGLPETEYSWFPGYGIFFYSLLSMWLVWKILTCAISPFTS